MTSQEIHVIAFITPLPGKEERVKEILSKLAENVKEHEAGVLKYQFFEQYEPSGTSQIIVEELYENQAAFDKHATTQHMAVVAKTAEEEGFLAGPLDVRKIKPTFGFISR